MEINPRSTENQHILSNFVKNNVYLLVNDFVEFCIANQYADNNPIENIEEIYGYDYYESYKGKYFAFDGGNSYDWENCIEECENVISEIENEIFELEEAIKERELNQFEEMKQELDELNTIEPNMHEVLEYWSIDSWLWEKLKDKGEVCFETPNSYIWGRTTTGQAILLDSVICEIALENGWLV